MRFTLFPHQEDFIRWIAEREAEQKSGLAEKSRDVGFTWLCASYAVHGWLFRRGFTCAFGSRKVALVDTKGDTSCIFEKIRFLVRHFPAWMLPKGYDERKHSGFCKLLNPDNGASITGEGGAQIGRGGRTSIYFIDEAAFLQFPKLADAALSATSRVKIWVSTPNGPGNSFAQKRFGGKLAVFTFHWRQDPRKDDAWYEQMRDELGDVALAQEVDIDYTASLEGITIPAKYVRAAVNLPIEASGEICAGFDVSAGGKNESVLILRQGPIVREIVTTKETNLILQTGWLIKTCEEKQVRSLSYDALGVGEAVEDVFETLNRPLAFTTNGVRGGETPSDAVWPNGKTSKQWLVNKRAELYWKVRRRFEKAYHYRLWLDGKEGGQQFPHEEMISIPQNETLIAQLSMPLTIVSASGKVGIESKQDMKKRGVASPDHADALIYSEDEGSGWADAVLSGEEMQAQSSEVSDLRAQMENW